MINPLDTVIGCGLAGGLFAGAVDLSLAYSAKAGNPLARRRAWLRLVLGLIGGPIMAEVFAPGLATLQPWLSDRGVAVMLGWIAANDPRGFFSLLKRTLLTMLGEASRSTRGDSDDRP